MTLRDHIRLALVTGLIAGLPHTGLAQEEQTEKPAEKSAPATVKAEAGSFAITVELKGTLQPEKVAAIAVEPKEWTALKVVEFAEQGTAVETGDVILKLDTDEIEKQIRTLEFGVRLAELTLDQTQREMTLLEKTAPLDLEIAERAFKESQEDLDYYLEVDRDLRLESNRRSLENAEFSLEYATEELVQLEKMYKEDDLTEETEEMILKRTKRSVENAKYSLELSRIRSKRLLETLLPREEQQTKDAAVRAELAYRRAAATTPLSVDRKQIELAKLRYDLEESLAKLKALKADRDLLIVKAPMDGVVYHGTWDDGTWSLSAAIKAALKVGGTVPAKTPVMTIVQPRPLSIETTVEEKDVAHVTKGATGTAAPTAYPDRKLACQVTDVSTFPTEPGKFTTTLSLGKGNQKLGPLVPGMTVAITLTPYENADAITVPSKSVFEEDGQSVVYVVDGETAEPRVVTTGRTHGGKTEIVEGLRAGETIRTTKP
jgi:HlyD family secretion protein